MYPQLESLLPKKKNKRCMDYIAQDVQIQNTKKYLLKVLK